MTRRNGEVDATPSSRLLQRFNPSTRFEFSLELGRWALRCWAFDVDIFRATQGTRFNAI